VSSDGSNHWLQASQGEGMSADCLHENRHNEGRKWWCDDCGKRITEQDKSDWIGRVWNEITPEHYRNIRQLGEPLPSPPDDTIQEG